MLDVLLLICQTFDDFLTSKDVSSLISLILFLHFIFFNFIHYFQIILSYGCFYILICFLFFFLQQLYTSLQFGHVDLLLLTNLARLHDRFKILGLFADLAQRKVAFLVQVDALFADTTDFHGWRIVLLRTVIQQIFYKSYLLFAVVIVVLRRGSLVVCCNLNLRHGIFI